MNKKHILFILLLISVLLNTLYSCSYKEPMQSLSPMPFISPYQSVDSIYNYNSCSSKYTDVIWYVPDKESNLSSLVLPSESMVYYKKTEYRPECCNPTCGLKINPKQSNRIGRTSGCPCYSNEQLQFLRDRGNNNIDNRDNTIF